MEEPAEVKKIKENFAEEYLTFSEFRGDITIEVKKEKIVDIIRLLKEDKDTAYNALADLTAVDYLEIPKSRERFAVVYILYSHSINKYLKVKAWVPESDASINSVTDMWRSADWPEREAAEMYGITFKGHPDPRKLLLPDYYENFPLRKDYPLRGKGERDNFPVVTS